MRTARALQLVRDAGDNATRGDLVDLVLEVGELLLTKNASYGDSALNPLRVFSQSHPIEALRVRLDDKLTRLARVGPDQLGEDTYLDILGYLCLLVIAERRRA